MTDLQAFLLKLNKNLNTLREREAKHAGNTPLELLNQIDDHEKAIALTQQRIDGQINEAEWQEALEPLLVAMNTRSGEAAVNRVTISDVVGGIHNSIIAGGNVNITIHQSNQLVSELSPRERVLRWVKGGRQESLADIDLSSENLGGVDLEGADLSEANLKGANMEGADLKGAILCEADLSRANLREAKLSGVRYTSGTKWPVGFDPVQAGAICED
jgi:pentapeptide repeat protein